MSLQDSMYNAKRKKKNKLEIHFNANELRNFVTGFRSRKQQRRKIAAEELAARTKKAKNEARKERRKQLEEEFERQLHHTAEQDEATLYYDKEDDKAVHKTQPLGFLPNVAAANTSSHPETSSQQTYEDGDTTTVVVRTYVNDLGDEQRVQTKQTSNHNRQRKQHAMTSTNRRRHRR